MNNKNQQNQTNKIGSSLGKGIINELIALKKEMAGRIEEIITRIEQNSDRRLEEANLFFAGSDDGENLEDSIGFNIVNPMGDVPLEMVRNVLRPGDYSGAWHGHAVKFSIQQIFPTGQFNGIGEFVGGPHNGTQFGFTGRTDSDGRLTISRDVGTGSQVASDANFEIDSDSIVWQGLTKGPGIGDAGLPFEFRVQSINLERIDHSPSKFKGDDPPVEKARTPFQAKCSTFGIRSLRSEDERQLIVVNQIHDRSTKLYWIDFDGKTVFYTEIPPFGKHGLSTYCGHAWVAENSLGHCDIVFIVQNNVEIIIK